MDTLNYIEPFYSQELEVKNNNIVISDNNVNESLQTGTNGLVTASVIEMTNLIVSEMMSAVKLDLSK